MCSTEDYEFKQYFKASNKLELIGRLIIESFIETDSFFHEYIATLPKKLSDPFHLSATNKDILVKHSFIKANTLESRKAQFESLKNRIPLSQLPEGLLSFEAFNWTSSIINCYGYGMKRHYHESVKSVEKHVVGEVCLRNTIYNHLVVD